MRMLLVDDHSMFCDGLKLLLETLGVATHIEAIYLLARQGIRVSEPGKRHGCNG